jgi:glucan phosphoethanolaminetransferase (alkaline phosphatase superfamily)
MNMGPKRTWVTGGALCSPPFVIDFAISYIACGVTSRFAIFVSHPSSLKYLFRVILLIVLVTQFTAVLHAGSLVTFFKFLSFFVHFRRRPRPGRSYFRPKFIYFFIVGGLYTEALIDRTVTCCSSSSEESVWLLGDISWRARLWNHS